MQDCHNADKGSYVTERLDATTPVFGDGTVGAFWAWAYSSLAENAIRGVFAEYLVGLALGVLDEPRLEWDAFDLHYGDIGIEVKSSADHQVWKQSKPSIIRFDVDRKKWWNAKTNEWTTTPKRPADVYVFCRYRGLAENAAVVNQENWEFYVVPTLTLDKELGDQKSMGLSRLQQLAEPLPWSEIRKAVDQPIINPRNSNGNQ